MNSQPNTPAKIPGLRVEGFPVFLSVSEASKFLGIRVGSVRALIRDKQLPVVQVGRAFMLRRATLLKWAEGAEFFVRG